MTARFRFSLAAALCRRRGEHDRAIDLLVLAQQELDGAVAALRAARALETELREQLLAAKSEFGRATYQVEAEGVGLARCHRILALNRRLVAALPKIESAQGEVARREEQARLRTEDVRLAHSAVLVLEELETKERCSFQRIEERRADAARLDDVLVRWRPRMAREYVS